MEGEEEIPWPELLWLTVCGLALHLLSGLAGDYVRSKPPLMVSLADLINVDLAAAYRAAMGLYLAVCAALRLGWRLPPPLARAASSAFVFWVLVAELYLATAAAAQYAHVRLRRADLTEELTEGQVRAALRAAIGGVAACLVAGFATLGSPFVFYHLLAGEPAPPVLSQPHPCPLVVVVPLAVSAVAANCVLRALTFRERRKAASEDDDFGAGLRKSIAGYAVLAAIILSTIVVCLAFRTVYGEGNRAIMVMRMGMSGALGVVLPAAAVLNVAKLRRFAARRAVGWAGELWAGLSKPGGRRVAPRPTRH